MKKSLLLKVILFLLMACFSAKGTNYEENNRLILPDSHICGNYLSNQNTTLDTFQDNYPVANDENTEQSSTSGELYKPNTWSLNDHSKVNDVQAMQIIPEGPGIQGEVDMNVGDGFFFMLILLSLYSLSRFHTKKKE